MKRFAIIFLALTVIVSFSGIAMADSCLYGCGIIKGTVKLCGNFNGQPGAVVTLAGPSARYFPYVQTVTDAAGFYKFKANLPTCKTHRGRVTGFYRYNKCCGAPDEAWGYTKSWSFRPFNQAEVLKIRKNLKLRWMYTF